MRKKQLQSLALILFALHEGPLRAQDATNHRAGADAKKNGSIRGWVKDAHNGIVVGAEVKVVDNRIGPEAGVKTDVQGYFELKDVPPGQHWMIVTKNSAGFADPRWQVMSIGMPRPLEVQVHPGQTLGPITINVGTPRGRILFRVTSAATGAPVQVSFEITIPSVPGASLLTGTFPDGIIDSPVPPVPINLEITDQEGGTYQPVRIINILVPLERVKEMDIKLVPKMQNKP